MPARPSMKEDAVRDKIQDALEEANDPDKPITLLVDFLLLVQNHYLVPAVYQKYEVSIVLQMWSKKSDPCPPPTPAASTAHESPDLLATSSVLEENPGQLSSLEAKDNPDSVWIALPTSEKSSSKDPTNEEPTSVKYEHARYKQHCFLGSYVRSDAIKHKDLKAGEHVFVALPWHLGGSNDETGNDSDSAAALTACCVVNEDEAKKMGMDVDVLFGRDHDLNLEQQAFGPWTSPRLYNIIEEEPQTSALPAISPVPEQQSRGPSVAVTFNGPVCVGADVATVLADMFRGVGSHPAPTRHDATG